MDPLELQALVAQVVVAGGMFAGVAHLLIEFAVKPLTRKVKKDARRQWRRTASVGLPVLLPIIYLVATQAMPWKYAPIVMGLAFGTTWMNHGKVKKNDKKDAE